MYVGRFLLFRKVNSAKKLFDLVRLNFPNCFDVPDRFFDKEDECETCKTFHV